MRKPLDIQSYAFDLNESAAKTLDKFTETLRSNPKYAFEWATGAMEAAAQNFVASYIIQWHERAKEHGASEQAINAGIIQHATAETFRMATQTSQSTSVTSNTMERYVMAEWAKLASKAFDRARFSGEEVTVVFQAVPSAEAGK